MTLVRNTRRVRYNHEFDSQYYCASDVCRLRVRVSRLTPTTLQQPYYSFDSHAAAAEWHRTTTVSPTAVWLGSSLTPIHSLPIVLGSRSWNTL